MTHFFISDLHLDASLPYINNIFINFLHSDALQADALYILGDFFESWIGDDDLSVFHQHIIKELRRATDKGLPIYIMHGNRDFLLGKKFFQATGCQLLPDEYVIELAGVPTLLMHGDTLCTDDISYLKFRKKSRMWLFQKLFLMKSLAKRRLIAENMRAKSKLHTSSAPEYIMDIVQAEVERIMTKHDVYHLIHGHTHRLAKHEFILNNAKATRTVLGPWHKEGSVLVCDSSGKQEFITLN